MAGAGAGVAVEVEVVDEAEEENDVPEKLCNILLIGMEVSVNCLCVN